MLKIFNTLTCKKETFTPINKNTIALYVCGVTVYNFCHIGHGRTFVVFDMIVRYLRYSHFKVKYVRNITDIDDKIIQKSIKEEIEINVFTEKMIQEMHKDFSNLGILKPDIEPRVTDCMNEIINIITELIEKKHAYIDKHGDVVFSIESDANYGTLSHQSLCSLKAGSRIPINDMKNNPLDFILWKKDSSNKYCWDSPWGKGRPGWHIECSAMTKLYFDNHLDIHGGGSDLLFPHHENERSQSSSLNQKLQVNYWIHSGMVIIKNKKMSKSLGNEYLLKDILLYYDAETVRYFFLSTHYRHPIYYSIRHVKQAQMSLERLYRALYNTNPIYNTSEGQQYQDDFQNAMNDDFNTPKAFAIFFKLSREINHFKNIDMLKTNLLAFRLCSLAGSLGLLLQKPESFLQKKFFLHVDQINKIENLVQKRNVARKNRLWKQADEIRKKLLSWDVILEDSSDKTIWRKK